MTQQPNHLFIWNLTKWLELPNYFFFRIKPKTLTYLALAKIVKITKLPDDPKHYNLKPAQMTIITKLHRPKTKWPTVFYWNYQLTLVFHSNLLKLSNDFNNQPKHQISNNFPKWPKTPMDRQSHSLTLKNLRIFSQFNLKNDQKHQMINGVIHWPLEIWTFS